MQDYLRTQILVYADNDLLCSKNILQVDARKENGLAVGAEASAEQVLLLAVDCEFPASMRDAN